MTCTCGHDEAHHYTDSSRCMVCECEQYEESELGYDKEWYDEESMKGK